MSRTGGAVLVVDSDPAARGKLLVDLQQHGFEVELADGGLSAVAAVKRRKFDLAVTELTMPGLDGVATVEALKALDPEIEVVVASASGTIESAVACMKNGAFDFLQKPYGLVDLKRVLERARQKSQLQGGAALYEATRALFAPQKRADLVPLVVGLAKQALRGDEVALLLRQPDERGFQIHRLEGSAIPPDAVVHRLSESVGVKPLLLSGAAAIGFEGCVSALVYPLAARERSLGALMVLRRSGSPEFVSSELQKGTVFASQLALALDNTRLYDDLSKKVLELMATRQQLVQAEKLALAGALADSVALEVNNPLGAVQANLDSLRDYSSTVSGLWLAARLAATHLRSLPDAASQEQAERLCGAGGEEHTGEVIREIAEILDDSLEGVRRIRDLVAALKQLGDQRIAARPENVDVNKMIAECVGASPGSDCEQNPAACFALVDRDDLRTAVLSLSAFASAPERRRSRAREVVMIRSGHDGGRPYVLVSDPTVELSENERVRIFDPQIDIDTRQGRMMRLNLGLSLTYEILRRNGAEIVTTCDSASGLTFRIQLETGA
jgi:DNA-binding response OmpR family regulator